MSEAAKTMIMVGLAVVIGVTAYAVSREAPERTADVDIGSLFIDIEDPLAVKRMKIVKFDENEGRQDEFEVAQVEGVWSIPSHENYPADAQQHLVDAVGTINHLEILDLASESAGSHEDFGVVDPTDETLGRGAVGVGTRVSMSGADGEPLADFIIGKKVEDADDGEQYYVRRADKSQVYTLEIDPDNLSTKFEDWIERDLLKLDPLDLTTVEIDDYTLQKQVDLLRGVMNIGQDRKSQIRLSYDQEDLEWKLDNLTLFKDGEPEEVALKDDEEVEKTKLNDLKTALDDLKIVNVHRKIEGLEKGDIKEFVTKNRGAMENLIDHGFYLAEQQGQLALFSDNGQINVGMKDGVEYILRFGNIAGAGKDDDDKKKEAAAPDGEQPGDEKQNGKAGKALRNLLVLAQFNQDLIGKPELEDVPPEEPPAAEDEPAEKPADEPADEGAEKPADEAANEPADEPKDKQADSPTKDNPEASECGDGDETAGPSEPAAGDEAAADKADPAEEEAKDEADGESKAESEPKDKAESEEDKKKKLEEWKQKRDNIIKENERKQKEYDEKIEKAKQRVAELNKRFAAWYYVIDDETYRKIRLDRSDIIKQKEKEEGSNEDAGASEEDEPKSGLEEFNELKEAIDNAPTAPEAPNP